MKSRYNIKIKPFAVSVIALSLSLILGYIEAIFPLNIGLVGIKIGLSNIVTLIMLKILDIKHAFIINVLRLIILGILFSNMIRFFISVSGFVLSFFVMVLSIKILNFDINISSILGGVFHNIGQVICVALITANLEIFRLLYLYIVIGAISGLIIGLVSKLVYQSLSKVLFE